MSRFDYNNMFSLFNKMQIINFLLQKSHLYANFDLIFNLLMHIFKFVQLIFPRIDKHLDLVLQIFILS